MQSQVAPGLYPPGGFGGVQEGLRYVGSGRGKVFTAWIGKVAPTVEKESLREILECCGSIRVFRPYIDSTKGFCFVTFHNAQGVMLAETLLQGLVVDGQTLLVRFNKSTEQLVTAMRAEKSAVGESVVPADVEAKAKERIQELVGQRKVVVDSVAKDASAAASAFLSSLNAEPVESERVEVVPPKKSRRKPTRTVNRWQDALWALEKNERERLKRCELESDKKRDLAQERQRQIYADNEGLDPEENTPIHLRPEYRNSREQAERKKRKDRELQEDLLEEERMKKEEEKAKTTRKVPEKPVIAERKEQGKRAVTFDEEDMDAKEKKLIPIQYSKEEMAVGKDRKSRSRSENIRKSIMSKIPKNLEDLSKYDIKWEYFDVAGKSVHSKISKWIGKKIRDLMGEEEPSFCEFVFEQLVSHKSPSEVIDSINEVLDEDTEAFVLKLFGVVIFETERIMNDG
ncbi:RNA-binding protein 25 [Picochlorum sp. SENEW3]|nr:RNA-binding protein 25 [Picochlorum sp. SENEW3]